MKRLQLVALLIISGILASNAQKPQTLKRIISLQMPKTADDEKPGTRGASLTWHPLQKKYYAVFAGNADYPLAVFNGEGKRLSDDDQTALLDCRGLWYEPSDKSISGNGYKDNGWFSYKLDKKGMPTDYEIATLEMAQPNEQSVGAYNAASKEVLFLYRSQVYIYDEVADLKDSLMIHWGRKKSQGQSEDEDMTETPEDYNYTTVIFTGIKGQEIGVLNVTNKQIELYDIKTGYLSKTFTLPGTATTEASFNFAYANDMYWLFDMQARKWVGYK